MDDQSNQDNKNDFQNYNQYKFQNYHASHVDQGNYQPPNQFDPHTQQQNVPNPQFIPADDTNQHNYRYPSAKEQPGVNYAPELIPGNTSPPPVQTFNTNQYYPQYGQQYGQQQYNQPYVPQYVPFEVSTTTAAYGGDQKEIRSRIDELDRKLDEWKVYCYKAFSFIFAVLNLILFVGLLFGIGTDRGAHPLLVLIFSGWQTFTFWTAYQSVKLMDIDRVQQSITLFMWLMIVYGVVQFLNFLTEENDPDRVLGTLIFDEFIFGLFWYRARKIRDIMEEKSRFQSMIGY